MRERVVARYLEARDFIDLRPAAQPVWAVSRVEEALLKAPDGVVFVADPGDVLSKYPYGDLSQALKHGVMGELHEELGYIEESENHEWAEKYRRVLQAYERKAKLTMEKIVSPRTNKPGWKVTLDPAIPRFKMALERERQKR